ncbi:2-hydroxyacyl-CoA lyase 1 [Oopsacas minuta]|uniref:2-hydroxyacyl-CoA lyase n=1 Tax=Oopsacas minuta TaxID=111878 RepID=A0AAV7K2X1_9METZ|nr:2-hydroxyacyl-CoA lyase 1 [Oopsacas minuta]
MSISGAEVLALSLHAQGIEFIFGIVGIPVIEVATACQQQQIHFISMRNEQAASYAASAVGYLTDSPGVCLCVSGPGLVHSLAGMANAQANGWPLIVVGGAANTTQEGCGAFQESPQVQWAAPYCKLSIRPSSIHTIPSCIERAVRISTYGRPGVVYIDLPGDMINTELSQAPNIPVHCPPPPLSTAPSSLILDCYKEIYSSHNPLVVIGKGCVLARASSEVREFINQTQLPFLPTPMGKGVLEDTHPCCVGAARSLALSSCDTIVLLGARLNWQLHFGLPPRFNSKVRVIQIDICPEELHSNVPATVAINGHIRGVVPQLTEVFRKNNFEYSKNSKWWRDLMVKCEKNRVISEELLSDRSIPMNFYCAMDTLSKYLPKDSMIVSEGASTMDIGRTMLPTHYPGHRLDAGTYGTMGVGLGFAIAIASIKKFGGNKYDYLNIGPVVCVEGDSAFGFSGMEIDTAARYQLPIVCLIFNNSGISFGVNMDTWEQCIANGPPSLTIPPVALKPGTRYDMIAPAFGCEGFNVRTPEDLEHVLNHCFSDYPAKKRPVLVNIEINPQSQRKPQEHFWLTRSKI